MAAPPKPAAEQRPALRTRNASAADADAILSINRQGAPGVSALTPADVAALLEKATSVRLAEEGDQVDAYLVVFDSGAAYDGEEFLWFRERYDRFLYVDQVAVAAPARGRGIATRLYADLERQARENGTPRLVCEVNLEPDNPTSRAFHLRHGFRQVAELRTRDGRLVSLMEKRLP